jgi:alpha-mannosidase
MGDKRVRLLFRLLTSRPLNRVTSATIGLAWKAYGEQVPREWIDGLDRFFARELIGNVASTGAGPADAFRLPLVNAWFNQRLTGIELGIDGVKVPDEEVLVRFKSGEMRACDITREEFPPESPTELIALGRPLADGLHFLDLNVEMELVGQDIPILPVEMRDGVGDFMVLPDKFHPLPDWPPGPIEGGVIHFVPHIHYDVEWLRGREVFEELGAANLRELVHLMESDHDMTFATDQVPQLEAFRARDPRCHARFEEMVREGRIEPVNGMYAEPDTNLISGESLARQSIAWQRYCEARFGVLSKTGWLIDSFGMSAQLPQIFKKTGTDNLVFSRARPPDRLPSEFIWEGLDGTTVVAHAMPAMYYPGHPMPAERLAALRRTLKSYLVLREKSASPNVLCGAGIDHGKPQREYGDMVRAWNREVGDVEARFSTPSGFFDSLDAAGLPLARGEFQRELWGTYSARISLKQLNRLCEFELADAGKIWAVAAALGRRERPAADTDELWKSLMDCQFHDQICGCCIDEVAEGMRARFRQALSGAKRTGGEAASALAGAVDGSPEAFTVVAFNPLAQPSEALLEFDVEPDPGWSGVSVFSGGRRLPSQVADVTSYADGTVKSARVLTRAALPGLGYRMLQVVPGEVLPVDGPEARADGLTLSNGLLSVEVDRATGLLGRATLASGRTMDIGGANRLTLERDLGELYLPRAFGTTWLHRREVHRVRVVESGPLRATIEIKGRIRRSAFRQRVSLCAGSPRIDLETFIDLLDKGFRLRGRFPTGIKSGRWVHEVPYGWIERPPYELAAQNFVDVSDPDCGVTLINMGIPGNKIAAGDIHLTFHRTVHRAFQRETGPGSLELGEHLFQYALYPHDGDHVAARSTLEAHRKNNPPRVFIMGGRAPSAPEAASLLECLDEHVILSAAEARDGGTMVRLWEASGSPRDIELRMGVPVKDAFQCDLLEHRERPLEIRDGSIFLHMGPFEVATVLIARP